MDDIKKDLEKQREEAAPPKPYRTGKKRETRADLTNTYDPAVPSPYAQEKCRTGNPRKTDGSEHDYEAIKQGRGAGAHGKAPPFKKGNKYNQTHRHKHIPKEVRGKSQVLTPAIVRDQIAKFSKLSIAQLQKKLQDPSTTMIEHMVGSVMVKAAQTADPVRFGFLLDRSIGKVKEQKEIELRPIVYKTNVRPDGSLLQAVIDEESKSLPAAHEILENAINDAETIDAEVTNAK